MILGTNSYLKLYRLSKNAVIERLPFGLGNRQRLRKPLKEGSDMGPHFFLLSSHTNYTLNYTYE